MVLIIGQNKMCAKFRTLPNGHPMSRNQQGRGPVGFLCRKFFRSNILKGFLSDKLRKCDRPHCGNSDNSCKGILHYHFLVYFGNFGNSYRGILHYHFLVYFGNFGDLLRRLTSSHATTQASFSRFLLRAVSRGNLTGSSA